jgi:SH3 domain protein
MRYNGVLDRLRVGDINMTITRSGKLICALLLIFICFSVKTAHSETRYVSDVLIVTLRQGPGSEYEVIRTLITNTPFEVLEEGDGYLKIRTTKGEEGWVSTRYTTTNTPKPIIISGLEKKIGRLQTKIEQYEQKNKAVHTTEGKMVDTISSTQKELAEIKRKYTSLYNNSKNVVALADAKKKAVSNNAMLKEENKELKARMVALQKENTNFLFTGLLKWFLVGAGVLLTGMILGRMSKKTKSYY